MRFSRTAMLVGAGGLEKLEAARVAVFGLGGVGSYALEALARAGVGNLHIVDADVVEPSNINRQILALEGTVGRPKVEVARERVGSINPLAKVTAVQEFITPEKADSFIPRSIEYAVDAIDTITSKTALIAALHSRGIPFVVCMGAARSLSYTGIRVADISATRSCPLARAVRKGLREMGIARGVRCVYVETPPRPGCDDADMAPEDALLKPGAGKRAAGSISFLPGLVGLTAAGVIINNILSMDSPKRRERRGY
jgi:tRNA threonylcarbamoyladenosine dehydratase